MLGRTNTGGGGGGLNFKVICNPQPSTAKENTIWIDTDRINNTHFSATQPENMADYDVWITTGTSSTVAFSATKKNPIMVYPISANQYIGGALVNKTAKSWQDGEWAEWIPEGALFWNGYHCPDITGGWAQNPNSNAYGIKNTGTVTFSDVISLTSAQSSSAIATTKNAINFSNCNILTLMISDYVKTGNGQLLVSIHNAYTENIATDNTPLKHTLTAAGEANVDVSGVSGLKYVSVFTYNGVFAEVSQIKTR